jgi:manganese transport system ATP-binding protein
MREVRVMPAVEAVDLEIRYGSTIALRRSSFVVPDGAVTAVVGPNGSGKSTVLSAIAGLVRPSAGSIEVAAQRRGSQRIAYVMQTTKVNEALPISVREVVAMGRYASAGAYGMLTSDDREAVDAALDRMGIREIAGQDLSGGQRQRVFVAQGLAQDHDVLLLDEPLTGIDLPTAQAIDAVIHDVTERGCTVVMATHDLSEARAADHVLLLSGAVVASGSPSEVLTAENLRVAYGQALLHVDGSELLVDDPHHQPVEGRHIHRDRSAESAAFDLDH